MLRRTFSTNEIKFNRKVNAFYSCLIQEYNDGTTFTMNEFGCKEWSLEESENNLMDIKKTLAFTNYEIVLKLDYEAINELDNNPVFYDSIKVNKIQMLANDIPKSASKLALTVGFSYPNTYVYTGTLTSSGVLTNGFLMKEILNLGAK